MCRKVYGIFYSIIFGGCFHAIFRFCFPETENNPEASISLVIFRRHMAAEP